MSTLTKILIVLLTISSVFLCGIVVTYVANADNYRQKYNGLKADRDSLSEKVKSLTKQLNEKIKETDQQKQKLNNEIASLKAEFSKIQTSFKNAEREKADLLVRSNSWEAITKNFTKTTDEQKKLFEDTLVELNKVQAEQIKEQKELSETTSSLIEKMAIIETLQTEKRRMLEENTELQNKLNQLLQPIGKVAAVPVPVTPEKTKVRSAVTRAKDIALQGLITEIDLKNSMVIISIGTADGVKEGMKFHVTRGDEFLCDILIIDVDAEKAVGILDLVQQQPKTGDNVSTNL